MGRRNPHLAQEHLGRKQETCALSKIYLLARALARRMAISLNQRNATEFFATLINQGLLGFGEVLAVMLEGAGSPAHGTRARCEIAWALRDAVESEAMRHAKAEAAARIEAWKARRAG